MIIYPRGRRPISPGETSLTEETESKTHSCEIKMANIVNLATASAKIQRLEALKAAIQAGNYTIDTKAIAEKLLPLLKV